MSGGSADASRVLKLLRAQRESWVDLGDGRRVRIVRPLEAQMGALVGGVLTEHVCEFVNGWEGFTEATFLGSAIGASDPLDFDAALWEEYVRDHAEEIGVIAKAIAGAVEAHLSARSDAGKN